MSISLASNLARRLRQALGAVTWDRPGAPAPPPQERNFRERLRMEPSRSSAEQSQDNLRSGLRITEIWETSEQPLVEQSQDETDRPPVAGVQDGLVAQRTQEWTERAARGSGAPLGSHRGVGSEISRAVPTRRSIAHGGWTGKTTGACRNGMRKFRRSAFSWRKGFRPSKVRV